MKNLVVSGNKRQYKIVDLENKKEFLATPRKTLLNQKGPIFIGDYVEIASDGTIVNFQERKNQLIRPRIVNLDLAIVVCSTIEPDFSSYLLDKFLTYLDFCNIPSIIAFTKKDKLDLERVNQIEKYISYYKSLGYKCYFTSIKDNAYLELKELIKGKVVAFMGQTGAGKSSLTNLIDPNYNRAIGSYSTSLGRGKHQTKEVILLPFDEGFIGDTPGFSSLDLKMIGLKETDLAMFFPGFYKYATKCYFNNCRHILEKSCQVKLALENGKLNQESYQNYVKLLMEMKGE